MQKITKPQDKRSPVKQITGLGIINNKSYLKRIKE